MFKACAKLLHITNSCELINSHNIVFENSAFSKKQICASLNHRNFMTAAFD